MPRDAVTKLIAEGDDGHAMLIERDLRRRGIKMDTVRLANVRESPELPLRAAPGPRRVADLSGILRLDIRVTKGNEARSPREATADGKLPTLPLLKLSVTDDLAEMDRCRCLRPRHCISKPLAYDKPVEGTVRPSGLPVVVRVPSISSFS